MARKILLVDDDKQIRKLVTLYLEKEGYIIEGVDNGEDALEKIVVDDYACVLLDIDLPGIKGTKVLGELRKIKNTPIIMVSGNSKEEARIQSFEIGADDYVMKPFSPRELVLRVKSLLNRTYSKDSKNFNKGISIDDMFIHVESRKITVKNKEINFAPKEYDLLLFLIQNCDKVFSRDKLLDKVWDYEIYGDPRTVDTHIKRIRKKLEVESEKLAKAIVTVWGAGYMFDSSKI
ncbi:MULTISPECIES: response regulator transcription factor [unclassified Gemella]|uniref:response regulator transcription factor n=1 Tax=unclassified Gemella TaxID=2624949 RepID=UPI0010743CDD|nr:MULTISPECIES: response regulator transcription factor [unclassified Gemella]MBF0710183.1 response regulator transcription factor [Gemella sp. GL1.1]MBF0746483.1 response regulator transcription factor [Gemella sp. 19428wG2_WT2a]NYS27527.1 response regulator transcription factor [Gemella sp. GL1]TFU60263.1 response regulator transcription factor [Gemella sp. WT2a]